MSRAGLRAALVAFGAARGARRLPEPSVDGWRRSNYRDRPVSLSTGRAATIGLLAAGISPAALVAVAAASAAGAYDDLRAPARETSADKGLRGHLEAVRAGRLSGGVVKVAVIGAGALASSWLLPGRRSPLDLLIRAGLIAGSANVINLFDLRPGRAAKIALLAGVSGVGSSDPRVASVSGAVTGAVLATIGDDLGETGMLGDLGANAMGAAIGVRLALLPAPLRVVALVKIIALTALSERVSFSAVIESVPALRRLDQLGRS
jgi:hypothetical protein